MQIRSRDSARPENAGKFSPKMATLFIDGSRKSTGSRRTKSKTKHCAWPSLNFLLVVKIYHDFLPTSTHAHNYITRSLDSLHPNEQVYMHFNIKRVEKVVLRRKKAKMGKTHCFTCFKMTPTPFADLPYIAAQLPNAVCVT